MLTEQCTSILHISSLVLLVRKIQQILLYVLYVGFDWRCALQLGSISIGSREQKDLTSEIHCRRIGTFVKATTKMISVAKHCSIQTDIRITGLCCSSKAIAAITYYVLMFRRLNYMPNKCFEAIVEGRHCFQ